MAMLSGCSPRPPDPVLYCGAVFWRSGSPVGKGPHVFSSYIFHTENTSSIRHITSSDYADLFQVYIFIFLGYSELRLEGLTWLCDAECRHVWWQQSGSLQ